nr:hypothetical protein [Tanacetum cinerariifolium]
MLVRGDIYDDLSLLRFYQNDNVLPWVNIKQKEGEDGPEWVVRSEFEDALANFMHEKKFHTKRIGEMLDQHRKEMHEQFSQIFSTIGKAKFLNCKRRLLLQQLDLKLALKTPFPSSNAINTCQPH